MQQAVRVNNPSKLFSGDGLTARVLRGSAFVMFGYGASQVLRLASNLILTRLLFPEAFGLMALVAMVEIGLALFTDLGIGPSIAQSKRGDDPEFLDTAYTLKVIRGWVLWLVACIIAYPASLFFEAPELALFLPIATFSMVISGFTTVRIESAFRHLELGKVTAIDLASQIVALIVMILLAWYTRSVVSLVIGGIVTAIVQNLMAKYMLKGHRNRLHLERTAVHELIHFGKWIFVSTLFSFFSSQGDKLVFGRFLTLYMLGIYNIGYYLGSFPLLLGQELVGRMMIPVYREVRESGSRESARKLQTMRYLMTGGLIALMGLLSIVGPMLVDLLYDDRYLHSGALLVLISLALMPGAIGVSYDRAALSAGDSRGFFVVQAARGSFGVLFLLIGINFWGIAGAIGGLALAGACVHPFLVWLAIKHKVWDPEHDAIYAVLAASLAVGAVWLHLDAIMALSAAAAEG